MIHTGVFLIYFLFLLGSPWWWLRSSETCGNTWYV